MKLPQIIEEFISYDETRPKICSPWIKGDKVYATNGHILISFPANCIDTFTVETDDGTRIDPAQCMEKEGFVNFNLNNLDVAIKSQSPSFIIESAFEDCDYCFGEGVEETDDECDCCKSRGVKNIECSECEGTGLSKIPNPRKGRERYRSTITKLELPQGEALADWKYLNIIKKTIEHFSGKWKVANKDSQKQIHFKQTEQGIDIVLMPMRG